MKTINVISQGNKYSVKLEEQTIQGMFGISINLFCNGEHVKNHFLNFKDRSPDEIKRDIPIFIENFNSDMASEWVQIYLEENSKN